MARIGSRDQEAFRVRGGHIGTAITQDRLSSLTPFLPG
jgi:hypothetical protein